MVVVSLKSVDAGVISPGIGHDELKAVLLFNYFYGRTSLDLNPPIVKALQGSRLSLDSGKQGNCIALGHLYRLQALPVNDWSLLLDLEMIVVVISFTVLPC